MSRTRWRLRTKRTSLGVLLWLAFAGVAWATEVHGRVVFGGLPVPGATVTATQGAQKLSTITDTQGLYEFPDLADGAWKLHIEMHGFAPLDGEVAVAANAPQREWELQLLSLEELLADTHAPPPETLPLKPRTAEANPPAQSAATKPSTGPKTSAAAPPPAPPEDDSAERPADGLLINGSESNAATSPFTLSPAFGNRRPGTKSLYTGGFGLIYDNSALDARPYSLSGLQVPKDAYNRVTALFTLGGPIRIPHVLYRGPNFFLAYQWTRHQDASTAQGLVPVQADHQSGPVTVPGLPIYVPQTAGVPATCGTPGTPFANNTIPSTCLSTAAQSLLSLYPLPNTTGSSIYNYEREILSNTHADALQSRLDKTVGRKDQLYGGFGFQSVRGDSANLFNFRDTTNTLGLDTNVNWQHRYLHQVFVLTTYHFTRQRTEVRPFFEGNANISGNAGITGNDQDSLDWGPPRLTFSSITPLSDANSAFNRSRTDSAAVRATTTRSRHTITLGGEFRRQESNQLSQQNPRGVFTFTGAATSATGSAASTSGSDLADFLVGVPDTSAVAFGNADKYFRQSVYNAYATDDWRVRPELTINAGMRWEYGAPPTELKGRLVNLDTGANFATATPVVGRASVAGYPPSLVNPDRHGFEPRIGISWRPIPASTLVVRAGYGIYDDTSIYSSSAQSMAQQAPLSKSVSVQNSAACPLTLANGFRNCAGTTADTFAVDPHLHVGYAQVWQLSAQRDLPAALVMTATYSGIKGTHGMQEFLPNSYAPGAVNPCPQCPLGFVYRTSGGNSTREAASLQLRRRLRSGFTAQVQYTYAKAVDDDAQVGAQGHTVASAAASASSGSSASQATGSPVIAQNWLNLRGERGLSTFDQRHTLAAQLQYTTGMGMGGGTLLTGWRGRAFKEWTVQARLSAASGLPETPIYLEAVPGTGFTGTIRPNLTGAPVRQASGSAFLNAAAYTAPAAGQWGTAGRDSIIGPNQLSLDTALSRTFRLRDPFNLDVRLDATNLLNLGVFTAWNTTVNSTTFGLPAAANPMRSVQVTGRLRF